MHLIETEAFVVPVHGKLLEEIINEDARERKILNINQFMKISNLELVDGVVMVTLDIYEDYLN